MDGAARPTMEAHKDVWTGCASFSPLFLKGWYGGICKESRGNSGPPVSTQDGCLWGTT